MGPPSSLNMIINYSDALKRVGSTANHTCNPTFMQIGDRVRTCQSDGTWNGSQPECKSKFVGVSVADHKYPEEVSIYI